MNWAYTMTNSPVMEALGWTLIHSLWQGAIVFLILKLLLRWVTAGAASLRYVLVISALAVMCCWSVSTFLQVYSPIPSETFEFGPGISEIIVLPEEAFVEPQFPIPFSEETETSSLWLESMLQPMRPYVPVLVWMWFAGLCFLSIRFTGNLYYLHQLKRKGAYRVSEIWEDRLAAFLMRTGIKRPVKLLESRRVTGPFTIGFLKPVILLPMGLLTGMDPFQIEAIIMHELAHIRRADYLINLLQSLVEVLFFYHPAVQWMSRQARIEREHCCDDLVMEWRQDPMVYAQALMNLQSSRIHPQSTFAMSITGNKPSFTQRIQRLFEPRTARVRDKAIMLLMVLSMSFALMAFNLPTTIESEPYFVEELVSPEITPITSIEILPESSQGELDELVAKLAVQDIHLHFDLLEFKRGKLVKIRGGVDTDFGHAQFSSDDLEGILLIINWERKTIKVITGSKGHDSDYFFGEDASSGVEVIEADEPFGEPGEEVVEPDDNWEEGDAEGFDFQFGFSHEEDGEDSADGFFEGAVVGETFMEGKNMWVELKPINQHIDNPIADILQIDQEGSYRIGVEGRLVFPDPNDEEVPVMIIDGEKFERLDLESYRSLVKGLDPEKIQNILVLKDGDAYEAFGVGDDNDVLIISTKKKAKLPKGVSFGTKIIDVQEMNSLTLAPNPVAEVLNLQFDLKMKLKLRIVVLDQEGHLVGEIADQYFEKGANTIKWSTSDLSAGKYILDFLSPGREE